MALPKVTDSVTNITDQPVRPVIGASALQALFDETGKDLKTYLNDSLTVALESTTNGDSGADNIGATALSGGVATTVQGILEELDAKAVSGSGALNTHKTSADHDGRYHTEAEVNALLLANQQGNHEGTWQGFSPTQTDPGIQAVVDSHTTQLADNAISPEKFTGTDIQKIQQALDYALLNNVAVKFAKMYDITGHTLLINRPDLYYATDRKQLYIIGVGGGIKKTDSGFIFDATYNNTGDVNVSNMKYESVSGAGTVVWNGDKIIRVKSLNNQYRNVDTILSAATKYTQSTYFINEHITGGEGWKFEARRYLDVVIDECLIEDCENFIRNTAALSIAMCNSLRIINNLIENLTGKVAELGGSYGCDISNNYIEFCNEYIDLDTLTANYPHIGLTITGNTFYQTAPQITAQVACIKLRNMNAATPYGNGGTFSAGNTVAGGVLYDLTNRLTQQFISGIGDFGTIIGEGYISVGKPYLESLADGFTKRSFGTQKVFYKQFTVALVPPSSDTVLTITPTSFTLKTYMTVNVMQDSDNFIIKNVVVNVGTNTIKITLTNTNAVSSLNVSPRVVISELYIA